MKNHNLKKLKTRIERKIGSENDNVRDVISCDGTLLSASYEKLYRLAMANMPRKGVAEWQCRAVLMLENDLPCIGNSESNDHRLVKQFSLRVKVILHWMWYVLLHDEQ